MSTESAREPVVRTVAGDVPARALGRVNYHEHLFQVTPLLPGDELDDEELSGREVASMREAGIDAVVDATPWGLGRRPAAVARISAASGVRVVATAGFHREVHYPDRADVLALTEEQIAELCLRELTQGQTTDDRLDGGGDVARGPDGAAVRAGLLKAGVGYWSITAFEGRVLSGVAAAQRATGAPVMVHLEHGTCAHDVLDRLEADGVQAERVVLAHIDRSPDPILYGELASRGAYLGCDGAARLKDWPESILIDAIAAAWEAGHGDRIMLGGDVARRSRYRAYGGAPGVAYLTERFTPRLATRIGDDAVRVLLEDNPRRLLAWAAPAA
ncbi:MAG: phosphotriesterase family protein [Microbacterium sp.]